MANFPHDFTFVAPVENQPVSGYSKDAKDVMTCKDGKAVGITDGANGQLRSSSLAACPEWHDHYPGLQQHLWPGSAQGLWLRG